MDDQLLDEIGEWACHIEKVLVPFNRFLDFSRLTSVAVRTKHVFAFARKRGEQYAGVTPVKSALFSDDWVGFAIAQLYENLMKETPIDARAFRDRATAAVWLDVPAEIWNSKINRGLPIRLARAPSLSRVTLSGEKTQCSSDSSTRWTLVLFTIANVCGK